MIENLGTIRTLHSLGSLNTLRTSRSCFALKAGQANGALLRGIITQSGKFHPRLFRERTK